MSKPYGYIYLIKNLYNNKVYIGKTNNPIKRFREHLNNKTYKTYLYYAINKYGKHNFDLFILGECYSKIELNEAEIECIKFFESNNPIYGYNMTEGGEGLSGYKFSDEHKAKIGKNWKGRKHSEISKQKMREAKIKYNPWLGKKHKEETKQKISKSHIGKDSSYIKGKNNPMYGISMIQRLINKYGEEVGKQKYIEWKKKLKRNK